MSDLTTAAATAVGAGAGAVTLAQFGIDPVAIGFGLAGAIAMQSLLRRPDDEVRPWRTLLVMLGSTLFAGSAAPAVSFTLAMGKPQLPVVLHAFIAAAFGMFAQPLALGLQRFLVEQGGRLWSRIFGGETK